MTRLTKLYKWLLYLLPGVLCFSYYPVIRLGDADTMNLELSLPLIWLVVFDVVACVLLARRHLLVRKLGKWWLWLLLPGFATLSLLWTPNLLRGLLTVGILWLIYFAGYAMWQMRSVVKDVGFRHTWWRVFFGSYLVACVWCVIQCIVDLAGASREASLMCAGCTYGMFGFPHPNGFAIEPQFMGNLLLAPAIAAGWLTIAGPVAISRSWPCPSGLSTGGRSRPKGRAPWADGTNSRAAALRDATSPRYWRHPLLASLLFFVFSSAIFLTFSRGAIYALVVAVIFVTVYEAVRQKTWKICKTLLIVAVAFVCTLCVQGVMAAVSPTNDTFGSGVAKVLNHLSLGIIDVRGEKPAQSEEGGSELVSEVTEGNVEEAVFDGYVEESTEARVKLSSAAVEVWQKSPATALAGVGIGGAGQALYVNNLTLSPKEIVQNEYASLLLETGLIGVALLVLTVILAVRVVQKTSATAMLLGLMVAYGITLCFFAGLPNALHIYLLMPLFIVLLYGKDTYKDLRKKAVS